MVKGHRLMVISKDAISGSSIAAFAGAAAILLALVSGAGIACAAPALVTPKIVKGIVTTLPPPHDGLDDTPHGSDPAEWDEEVAAQTETNPHWENPYAMLLDDPEIAEIHRLRRLLDKVDPADVAEDDNGECMMACKSAEDLPRIVSLASSCGESRLGRDIHAMIVADLEANAAGRTDPPTDPDDDAHELGSWCFWLVLSMFTDDALDRQVAAAFERVRARTY
jgi:hypothetical protein